MNSMTTTELKASRSMAPFVSAALCVAFVAFTLHVRSEEALLKPFPGVCYGPFREGQQPGGTYPSEAEIREDLSVLASLAAGIRTYGNENILSQIPEFCSDEGLNCYPGAWISGDATADWQQVSNLVAIADQGFNTTKLLVVGNETVQFNRTPKSQLIDYIEHACLMGSGLV